MAGSTAAASHYLDGVPFVLSSQCSLGGEQVCHLNYSVNPNTKHSTYSYSGYSLNNGPFDEKRHVHDLNTKLVCFSDPDCICTIKPLATFTYVLPPKLFVSSLKPAFLHSHHNIQISFFLNWAHLWDSF